MTYYKLDENFHVIFGQGELIFELGGKEFYVSNLIKQIEELQSTVLELKEEITNLKYVKAKTDFESLQKKIEDAARDYTTEQKYLK